MKRRAVIEDAIGETRAAIYEGRKLVELHVDRWSDHARPRIGERWTAKVASIDPSVGGMWMDLGQGPDGLLAFKVQKDLPQLTEGQRVDVTVTREAIAEKGPTLRFAGEPSRETVGPLERFDLKARMEIRFPGIAFESAPVGIIDTATERHIAIPGGGTITLDRTQALLAIDVDKGGAKTVADCSMNAARLIMVQLRLRGLGGLIVIDFPNLRQPRQRSAVIRAMEDMAQDDPASIRIAPFSRFGVVEMTRGQDGPSLDAILNDRFGQPTLETCAIQAIRRLEREAKANGGAQMTLQVEPELAEWLDTPSFDWRNALTERIGARFAVKTGATNEVWADR